jgi:Protein of unknown function (DUF4446)
MFVITTVAVAALALSVFNFIRGASLQRRFTTALGASDGKSLETTLAAHLKRVEQVDQRLATLDTDYNQLTESTKLASQKISIVRFNPFGDTGGDQSFSLAVLDAHDSGYVLTSIHGRGGTRVYIKPIDFGKSKYTLSDEEQQALSQAVKRTLYESEPRRI